MLVALLSAKGAPGVTTTARVLASVWPKDVVLADLDPAGGDVALQSRREDGVALDPDRGLLSLAADARRGHLAGGLDAHLQRIEGGLDVLCGITGPEQMTAAAPVMTTVAGALSSHGTDVIADCGRVVPASPVVPVLAAADIAVAVVRPQVEAYAHLRERLRWLSTVTDPTGRRPAVAVVVVTNALDHRSVKDLGRLLAHGGLTVPVLGRVAEDHRAADVVAGRLERRIDRSLLVRSTRELVEPVRTLVHYQVPATAY